MRIYYGALFCVLCLIPTSTLAASLMPDIPSHIMQSLNVVISPDTIIEPNSNVTVSVRSYMRDLDRSLITWYIDGKPIAESTDSISVPVGALGSVTKVVVQVVDGDGVEDESGVTLRPVEFELLWEGDGYTPPLYHGRTLGTPGTNINAYAEARFVKENGVRVLPSDIIYSWSMNNQRIGSASGRGKSGARVPLTGLFGNDILSVEATSLDGKFRASRMVRISSIEPYIVLYRAHPLLGIDYFHAIAEREDFPEQEITVAALPYFSLASNPRDDRLQYAWSVGGSSIEKDVERPYLLTFSRPDTVSGGANVAVLLNNAQDLLQATQKKWFIGLRVREQVGFDPFKPEQPREFTP